MFQLFFFRPDGFRETDWPWLRGRVLLHHQEPLPLRVSGLVQGGARVRGSLLQLCSQQPWRPQTGDSLPLAERHSGQQPFGQAEPGSQPVLHGQDEHQIRSDHCFVIFFWTVPIPPNCIGHFRLFLPCWQKVNKYQVMASNSTAFSNQFVKCYKFNFYKVNGATSGIRLVKPGIHSFKGLEKNN